MIACTMSMDVMGVKKKN
ncbi:MAG: hypothetical protein OSJ51_11865 [Parabacteroides distasonis]|nr:hypothetical protein [Parabacteroides distasonis]